MTGKVIRKILSADCASHNRTCGMKPSPYLECFFLNLSIYLFIYLIMMSLIDQGVISFVLRIQEKLQCARWCR